MPTPTTARSSGVLLLLAVSVAFVPTVTTAEESRPAGTENASPDEVSDREPEDHERRALVVQVLLWTILGIALQGGVVMVGILLYGGHARRVARTPLPNQTADDPFWYLRKGAPSDDEPPPDSSEGSPPDAGTSEERS